ncbi:hydroxyacylglutathione hydrolase [Pleionea sediminis]|uniref:hydroxyacylglutathione hydrolase n=1 Tax=Pleionea sediminis TaxID=2569479 RepID=UPI00118702B4|nr:hydroxyacylglutathione hydrolase [Pleionea sediminis]
MSDSSFTIKPIKAFTDNYIWALVNNRASECIVVDPGDAEPVENFLKSNKLSLSAILITHHHFDHTGGIIDLKKNHKCHVYGPENPKINGIDTVLKEGDTLELNEFGGQYHIIEVPGHTLDHIAYIGSGHVFCGDTLFSAGCGRLFEGTPEQMWHSLSKLRNLSDETLVYCTHEYTQANLKFAQAVEPTNKQLMRRVEEVNQLRSQDRPTVPSNMALEKATNPFLRAEEIPIKQSAETFSGHSLSTPVEVFATVRQWKDNF